MMLITGTASNLHALDGGTARTYHTTIPDQRDQHAKPRAVAVAGVVNGVMNGANRVIKWLLNGRR